MFLFLLSLLSEEELAALSDIYEYYYGYMKSIAFSVLKNNEDAEDAVQDSLEIIASNPYKYSDLRSNETKARITLIVRNKAIDIYRRNNRRLGLFSAMDDSAPDFNVPENNGIQLADALGRINQRYRDLLLMKYHYGYEINEIAAITGSSYGAVQRALHRAKNALAEELDTEE